MINTSLVYLFLSFGLICCSAQRISTIAQNLGNQPFNLATVQEITQFEYPQGFSGPKEKVIKFSVPKDNNEDPQEDGGSGSKSNIAPSALPLSCKSNCAVSFFSFRNKLGNGNRYLTYNSNCVGQVFWATNSGPSDLQKFVGYQFQNDVWTFQPKNCPNIYLRYVPIPFLTMWGRVRLSSFCSRWQVTNVSGNGLVKLWGSSPPKYWVGSAGGLVWAGPAVTPLVVEYWAN